MRAAEDPRRDPIPMKIALGEAVKRALDHNPQVTVAVAEIARAEALVKEARAGWYPMPDRERLAHPAGRRSREQRRGRRARGADHRQPAAHRPAHRRPGLGQHPAGRERRADPPTPARPTCGARSRKRRRAHTSR